VTFTPANSSPVELTILPAMAPVVIPCAITEDVPATSNAIAAAIFHFLMLGIICPSFCE
jgi:hypothetical protein